MAKFANIEQDVLTSECAQAPRLWHAVATAMERSLEENVSSVYIVIYYM